ncbi:MAG: chromosomal replication initiator protein DnaA [Chloroflexota bacterium]|nr:chromosomal replication initiator protein DnaA [Chloroflexota bacterium]
MWQGKPSELWAAVLGDLELQVTRPTYQTWLKETAGVALQDNTLTVKVPTPFAAEWLEKRMYRLIQTTAQRVGQAPLEVQFQVGDHQEAPRGESEPAPPPPAHVNGGNGHAPTARPSERYTFASFVVGPSNRLAYSAAQAVAEAPGHSYNPLFIYSGSGLGKTHLLHAIAHEVRLKNLDLRYVTSEQFTNEFISGIRERTTEEFRARYRSLDVLLIDDIQFISGKEQTQEGFFHTFNDLHNSSRQIVIASDRPPKALSLLEDRLRSRFEWGLIADIQPPDLETRMAILRCKATHLRMSVGDDVLEFLARKVQKNVRELEGSLNRLVAYAALTGHSITIETAQQALADLLVDASRRKATPDQVIEATGRLFNVTKEALYGKRRDKQTAQARQVTMYLLREELGLPFTEIGRLLGDRDHSTVIHAVGKINYDINVDTALRKAVLDIKERLSNLPTT